MQLTPRRVVINRESVAQSKRWVVKIGSALLTDDGRGLNRDAIAFWVEQLARLKQQGIEIIMVSSGAVAEGMSRLGWKKRPSALHELQAAAAIGQMGLVQAYESAFQQYGMMTAQILLTHDDLSHRERYLNARSTLKTLIGLGTIPIINENDTVVTDEIRFGDNDTLAALVANLVEAELLLILTDQEGMFDADPRQHQDAKLLDEVQANSPQLDAMASSSGGGLGRGGMMTKLQAARLAARSGSATLIAPGRDPQVFAAICSGTKVGTLFIPDKELLLARKQWLAGHLRLQGKLHLDAGATRRIEQAGGSLLAVGVTRVEGSFHRGAMVSCLSPEGREVARGLVNYSGEETAKIIGRPSHQIESILGYIDEPELIHRDNLVLL
ncbi:MAG: glutamate 5-kinase [Gammaproteobacteria bacterium]|nr:glutamate 5-kinase [Gammaproteobacteria bacterium]